MESDNVKDETGGSVEEIVTVTEAVSVHVLTSVPVTIYVVVAAGEARTDKPELALRPDEGDHVYEVAPPVVNVALSPVQIVTFGDTVTTGSELTDTTTGLEVVPVHPSVSVTITEYIPDVSTVIDDED